MKCRILLVGLLIVTTAGCVDSVDSVAREYRATTNEAIDAMMMIYREEHARRANLRIFKPMTERYKKIDKKLELVKMNREKPDFVREVLESDSVQIYLTDLIVNNQRYSCEIVRLKHVYQLYQEREKELLIAAGEKPVFDPREICPTIHDMLYTQNVLEPLRHQLTKPDLLNLMSQFPQWKITDYDKMWAKFAERREVFQPRRDIKLVQ